MTDRLDGLPVSASIDAETREVLGRGRPGAAPPTLASVHRTEESPFLVYLARQRKAAEKLGIRFRDEPLDSERGPAALSERIRALDRDPAVHAVLIQHPMPPPFEFLTGIRELSPAKDVDGIGPSNLGRLVSGTALHVPAVALAALAIARHYHLPIEGQPVAVVGRSATVGLPLALLLAARGPGPSATVTIAHSRTPDLRGALAGAKVIFSCAGQPGLLTRSVVPEGANVVDVGLSTVADASRPNGVRSVGDADAASLDGWARALTPVPGGVGPVTVAALMRSVAHAWEMSPRDGESP